MTVRVRNLQGGPQLRVSFSDDFTRANNNNLGSNWLRMLGNNDSGSAEAWSIANILTNQCQLQGQGSNNPNASLKVAWLPVPVLNTRYFNAPKTFVQATFVSFAGTFSAGLCLRNNQSHEAGPTTTPNGMDSYMCIINGRLDKITNGGALITIGAATVAIVNGTVFRLEAENVGTATIITTKANGVIVNQITELAAAFPIQKGWPGLLAYAYGGAPPSGGTMLWDDFSCGVF